MSILEWIRGNGDSTPDPPDEEQVREAVERVIALNPRLGLAHRCRQYLAPALARSLRYATDLVASLPAPLEASARGWASDRYLRAFFARPEELAGKISHSEELRAYFEQHPESTHTYAVLGMTIVERHVLGVALEGEALRLDVAQTTVSFNDHRIRICGPTELDLRLEVVRRVIDQLALAGLAKMATDRRETLEQGRVLLKRRLQLLKREGTGMGSVCGDGAPLAHEELSRLQGQLDDNSRRLAELQAPTGALERQLDGVCRVLTEPDKYVYLTRKRIRLDLMNVVQGKSTAQVAEDLEFHIAHIWARPPQVRAIALVRFARAELLPGGLLLDEAMREL